VRLFAQDLARSPGGFSTLLEALEDTLEPPASVIVGGDPDVASRWARELARTYRPSVRVFAVGREALPAELAKGTPPAQGALAWLCRGTHCLPPLSSVAAVEAELARAQPA
jgi:uncharacterized protein YyaL (SSP411 family)